MTIDDLETAARISRTAAERQLQKIEALVSGTFPERLSEGDDLFTVLRTLLLELKHRIKREEVACAIMR